MNAAFIDSFQLSEKDTDEIDRLVAADSSQYFESEVLTPDGRKVWPDKRSSKTVFFKDSFSILTLQDFLMRPYLERTGRNFKIQEVHRLRYSIDDHFDWHHDRLDLDGIAKRDLTCVLMLSNFDDYGGGLLEIRHPSENRNLSFQLVRGQYVIFPAGFFHRVTPVRSGCRETIVAWAEA